MAQIHDSSLTSLEIDTTHQAARVTLRPVQVTSWLSLGVMTGAATGVAANGAIFSLRNLATDRKLMIRRLGVGFVATTAFTAAQQLNVAVTTARSWTASDTGGTAIAITGANTPVYNSSFAPFSSVDCRISTTGALAAGTRTLDANPVAVMGGWAPAAQGVVLTPSPDNLLSQDAGDHPLLLGGNEGLVVTLPTAMGAGGVGTFYVSLEMAEIQAGQTGYF